MRFTVLAVLGLLSLASLVDGNEVMDEKKKHHHRRHHHKGHGHGQAVTKNHTDALSAKAVIKPAPLPATVAVATNSTKSTKSAARVVTHAAATTKVFAEQDLVRKMQELEEKLAKKEALARANVLQGQLEVNAPIPMDFSALFAASVAKATGCDTAAVKVLKTKAAGEVVEVTYEAPGNVVKAVESQVADPDSRLANGALHSFLVAKDTATNSAGLQGEMSYSNGAASTAGASSLANSASTAESSVAMPSQIDMDVEMPYGDLEPFGREDTAQELTESSIHESDQMVDQLERAEVAEEKRAVFRALTRLRGAAITSFDGIARSQTGNIDQYNKLNKWRNAHPLHHLADEEADVSKWAFPDNAD